MIHSSFETCSSKCATKRYVEYWYTMVPAAQDFKNTPVFFQQGGCFTFASEGLRRNTTTGANNHNHKSTITSPQQHHCRL